MNFDLKWFGGGFFWCHSNLSFSSSSIPLFSRGQTMTEMFRKKNDPSERIFIFFPEEVEKQWKLTLFWLINLFSRSFIVGKSWSETN